MISRYWLTGKERNIGFSYDLDKELEAWVWSNQGNHRGILVVQTYWGTQLAAYPGTKDGIIQMKEDFANRKIFETEETLSDDFFITLAPFNNPRYNQKTKPRPHRR